MIVGLQLVPPRAVSAREAPGMAQRANLDLDQLHHTAFGADQGAPSRLLGMSQDEDGFLWITGGNAPARFDGIRFDYPYVDLLTDYPIVVAMKIDAQGRHWLGHKGGGVTMVHAGVALHTEPGHDGFPNGSVFDLLQDDDATIWAIATGGVARWRNGHWTKVGANMGYPGAHPEMLIREKTTGDIYLQDADGNYLLRRGKARFEATNQDLMRVQAQLPSSVPWKYNDTTDGDALSDHGGALWVVGNSGIDRLRWPGNPPGKLPPITEHTGRLTGLTSDSANNLFEDREGDIWVSTMKGLDRFRVTALTPIVMPGNMSAPHIALAADGAIWAASPFEPPTELRSTSIIPHPEWNRWDRNAGGGDSAIFADADGIWMAGSNGLRHGFGGKIEQILAPSQLARVGTRYQSITRDGEGDLWVAIATYGLYRIVDGKWLPQGGRNDLPDDVPAHLTTDPRGRVWLAYSKNRLAMVDGLALRLYTAADGLAVGNVLDISFRDERVWVTGSAGVAQLDQGRFQSLHGTGENFGHASGIVETAQGDVWINTTHGIFTIDRTAMARWRESPLADVTFRRFDTGDGIDGFADERSMPSALEAADGKLWFVTSGGLSIVDPGHVSHNDVAPQPVITAVVADGKNFSSKGAFTLPPRTERLQIDFTAAALRMPERLVLQFHLDGFDEGWHEVGASRQASYARLPPGSYAFRVRAFNEDGIPGAQPAVLEFSLAPAWYQTWVFRIACLFVVLAALWFLHRWQIGLAQSRVRVENDARVAERERIARDLHDTLLQGVQGLLLQVETSISSAESPERIGKLEAAVELARASVVEARDKVASLRNETDALPSLSVSLAELGGQLAGDQASGFTHGVEGNEQRLHPDVREHVFAIGAELLRNAFKHAVARHIHLRIACGRRQLTLSVTDDGCGIDASILAAGGCTGHWGLIGLQERARELKGHVEFRSVVSEGTCATLTVPAAVAYKLQQ
ncbi:MAG: two-component regulator propeller domain-containing protein [Dokdonella sp.]